MLIRWSRWFGVAGLAWTTLATAQTAITTQSVNVRAGPDRIFPAVTWLMGNTPVTVVGCLEDFRWCDVVAGRDRGWVYSRYLALDSGTGKVTIARGGGTLGVQPVQFSIASYWGEHYRARPWFGRQPYWADRWQRRAPS